MMRMSGEMGSPTGDRRRSKMANWDETVEQIRKAAAEAEAQNPTGTSWGEAVEAVEEAAKKLKEAAELLRGTSLEELAEVAEGLQPATDQLDEWLSWN
jgi:HPt (histidine-containing phosphotransfer) domain-containing protein